MMYPFSIYFLKTVAPNLNHVRERERKKKNLAIDTINTVLDNTKMHYEKVKMINSTEVGK